MLRTDVYDGSMGVGVVILFPGFKNTAIFHDKKMFKWKQREN